MKEALFSILQALLLLGSALNAYEWAPARIEEVPPGTKCLSYDNDYALAPLMEVRLRPPEKEVHFQTRAAPCPRSGKCPQLSKSYLVSGDVAFVSDEIDDF